VARAWTARELAHERLADRMPDLVSAYDTSRRVEVLVDEFLGGDRLRGREALDVGCGIGDFSARLAEAGASVTACDIGPRLVEHTRNRVKCRAEVVDALGLVSHFGPAAFDVVVSSECIEHTPDPAAAVAQMLGVLKPGGWLSLSTPNIVWQPVVRLASRLRLRPFEGLENFSSWRSLRLVVGSKGGSVEREYGLHLWPFQFGLHQLSRAADRRLQWCRGGMINICLLARKMQRGDE
jgi:2-polyprenyl-3-methyl-5-hydroxy-6-metoxy-1,4-benzoquinol methylase